MKTNTSTADFIPSLDGLRACSILIVFAGHAGVSELIPARFGVTVFFFLSGYLITRLLIREFGRHGSIDFLAFYGRRLLRLGPPLALVLVVSVALVWLGLAQGDMEMMAFISQIFFFNNYYSIVSDLGSVDGLKVLWSLAVEEHFYLFFPFLFVLVARGTLSWRFLAGLCVAILLWRFVHLLVLGSPDWVIYRSTDTRIDSILFGCILALVEPALLARPRLSSRSVMLVTLAGLGGLVTAFLIRDAMFRSTLMYTLQGIALMPLFFLAVHYSEMWFFRPLNWKWMRLLGVYSYTFYLIHSVIIHAVEAKSTLTPHSWPAIVLSFGLSLAFAAAVYYYVEKPLKPLRSRLVGHNGARGREDDRPAQSEGTLTAEAERH